MQKTERSREEIKKEVYDIVDKLGLQQEHWKHLPMEEQVKLGMQFLRDKLGEKDIRPECGITTVLDKASKKAADVKAKEFFDGIQREIAMHAVRYE
jgi:hypothetical protein